MDCLYKLFDIETEKKEMLCFVGAGGKTTTMFHLARELAAVGKSVLVSTTTAIFYPESELYDSIIVSDMESLELFESNSKGITVLGRAHTEEGKLLGVKPEFLEAVNKSGYFDFVLVEADGSKRKPVKAPAAHEPVIPGSTARVLGLIGLDCIGKPANGENVHRPEFFCKVAGCDINSIIDAETLYRLITHKQGLFKAVPPNAKKYLVLNKAEGKERELAASGLAQRLLEEKSGVEGIVITSFPLFSFKKGETRQ